MRDGLIRTIVGTMVVAGAGHGALGGTPVELVQVNVDADGMNIAGDAANEPSIAVDPTAPNRLAIGWRQFDTVNSSFRKAGWAWTNDGGRTWTFPGVLENNVFRSDPVLAADADGVFYYSSLMGNFTCDLWRSDNGGQTWQPPVDSFGGDKQWIAIDRHPGMGFGNIYLSWSTAAGPYTATPFCRSVDGGNSFEPPIPMPVPLRWGTMLVDEEGTLFVAGIQSSPFDNGAFRVARSLNAKNPLQVPVFDQTFEVDMGGALAIGEVPNPSGLLGQVWIDMDRSDGPFGGSIYLLASITPQFALPADPQDVHIVRSDDGGATWTAPVRVNDDPVGNDAWQWFGTMSVAPNGRIDVVWNDTSDDASGILSVTRYSSSTDGGATWSPSIPVTTQWNSLLGWPQQAKIGDYYQMVSDRVGASLAFATTLNGEQDVWFARIGDYDCNDNGVPDSDDLASGAASDCNGNGIPDSCDIAAGVLLDSDGDGVPDGCEPVLPGDVNGDGVVNGKDLGLVLGAWGTADPAADVNGDGVVDGADLGVVLGGWTG